MTVTAPSGQAVIWIPLPTIITAIPRNCRVEQQFVDIDCKPVAIPDLSQAEAPEVLDIKLRTSDRHIIYRRWDDRLWVQATSEGQPLDSTTFAAVIQRVFQRSYADRQPVHLIQPENPFETERFYGLRQKPIEPIELGEAPLRTLVKNGDEQRQASFQYASENLILVDGIVHIRQCEPLMCVSDPNAEGYGVTRLSLLLPRLADRRSEEGSGPRRDTWMPWLEFRLNESAAAKALAQSFGRRVHVDFESIQYCFDTFPEEGLHGCSEAAGIIERAFGLVRRGSAAIGVMSDAAMLAYMALRRTLIGLEARMPPAAVRAVSGDKLLEVRLAIVTLAGAVAASPETPDLRTSEAEFIFRRACAVCAERESAAVDTDPALGELAA